MVTRHRAWYNFIHNSYDFSKDNLYSCFIKIWCFYLIWYVIIIKTKFKFMNRWSIHNVWCKIFDWKCIIFFLNNLYFKEKFLFRLGKCEKSFILNLKLKRFQIMSKNTYPSAKIKYKINYKTSAAFSLNYSININFLIYTVVNSMIKILKKNFSF